MHWPNLGKLAFTLDLCLLPRPDIQLCLSSRFPSRHCKPILRQLRHLYDVTPPPSFPPSLQYFYPLVQNNFAPLTCGDGIPPKLTMKSTPSSSSRSRRRRRRSKTPSPSTMARGLCSQGRRRLGELKMILTPFEGFPPHKIMMGFLPHYDSLFDDANRCRYEVQVPSSASSVIQDVSGRGLEPMS